MLKHYKTKDNHEPDAFDNVFLPLPPLDDADHLELEVYARFMRHFRLIPSASLNIKILSAIQFTADMIDITDALVSKMLADMGLRAPRQAFPESYLEHVDRTVAVPGWESGGPTASSVDMKRFWDDIGEDVFEGYCKASGQGQRDSALWA